MSESPWRASRRRWRTPGAHLCQSAIVEQPSSSLRSLTDCSVGLSPKFHSRGCAKSVDVARSEVDDYAGRWRHALRGAIAWRSRTSFAKGLRKVEALFFGATTAGEREAAGAAAERLKAKLDEASRSDPLIEMKFTMPDQWSVRLFIALCRRYGFRPFRFARATQYDGDGQRAAACVRCGGVEAILQRSFRSLDIFRADDGATDTRGDSHGHDRRRDCSPNRSDVAEVFGDLRGTRLRPSRLTPRDVSRRPRSRQLHPKLISRTTNTTTSPPGLASAASILLERNPLRLYHSRKLRRSFCTLFA